MLKRYQRAKKLPVLSVSIIDESSPPLVATARAVVDWRDRAGARSEAGTGFRPLRCWQSPVFLVKGWGRPKASASPRSASARIERMVVGRRLENCAHCEWFNLASKAQQSEP